MAQSKFNYPSGNPVDPYREYNQGPPPLPVSRWLKEKATGFIHPYNEEFAARSDLVENYYGPLPWENKSAYDKYNHIEHDQVEDVELAQSAPTPEDLVPKATKPARKRKAPASEPVVDPVPPAPPMLDLTNTSLDFDSLDQDQ